MCNALNKEVIRSFEKGWSRCRIAEGESLLKKADRKRSQKRVILRIHLRQLHA